MREIAYRCIRCYNKSSEALEKELPLGKISLSGLREIFNAESDDPLFDVWDVGEDQARQIEPYLSERLDLNTYDCFLETNGIWVQETRFLRHHNKSSGQQGVIQLHGVPLERLQAIFGVSDEDPMHGEIRVTEQQIRPLQETLSEPLDPARYDYWLCCEVEEIDLSTLPPEARPSSQPKHGHYLAPKVLLGFPELQPSMPKTPV